MLTRTGMVPPSLRGCSTRSSGSSTETPGVAATFGQRWVRSLNVDHDDRISLYRLAEVFRWGGFE